MQIEIHSIDLSGCNGYRVIDAKRHIFIDYKEGDFTLSTQWFEEEILTLLGKKLFNLFLKGMYKFNIPAKKIYEVSGDHVHQGICKRKIKQ